MTMETAIRLDKIIKDFEIVKGGPSSFKSTLLGFRHIRPETLRALDGISLEIGKGETVAVIGRNGSGKSTLLRIVGRVYKPTSGLVEVNGRMSTMLDLAAGFHPELTGRENIFFNGAIMGLSVSQMDRSLDRIIEFSELSEFIDAPIRTYSAGMLMRLGFAIAVETDPEILLIDEVLAVGDAEFQEKCYDRIGKFKSDGRTIVFVTHDMEAAKMVAGRTIWIEHGTVRADSNTESAVAEYMATVPKHELSP
jgi:lipopolysaccharide transport system ATP-binding protein